MELGNTKILRETGTIEQVIGSRDLLDALLDSFGLSWTRKKKTEGTAKREKCSPQQ